eukprot:5707609-Pyramimonas_sp.AAC.1
MHKPHRTLCNQWQQRGMGTPRCNVPAEKRGSRPEAARRTSNSTPISSLTSTASSSSVLRNKHVLARPLEQPHRPPPPGHPGLPPP